MMVLKLVIGIAITALNVTTLAFIACNFVKCYNRARNIHVAKKKEDVDFYFMQMLMSMILFFMTLIGTYTSFKAFILNPYSVLDSVIIWRLAFHVAVFCLSILMIWARQKRNPFA